MKKLISVILLLIAVAVLGSVTVSAEEVASGMCGPELTWTLDSEGVLTISGEGYMDGYQYSDEPWASYRGAIKKVIVEEGVTAIGDYAFYKAVNLSEITLADSITYLGYRIFSGCESLKTVTLPKSFNDCYRVDTGDGPNSAFSHSSITEIIIPEGITSVPSYIFSNARSLEKIIIPDSVTVIGEKAFWGCVALEEADFGNGLERIDQYAFYDCSSLTSVTLPESLTSLANCVFEKCTSLLEVTLPDSLESVDVYCFIYCSSLEKVNFGNGLKTLSDGVFAHCTSLSDMTLPDSITTLGHCIFDYSSALTKINIPKNLSVSYSPFTGSSITEIVIPQGISFIAADTFANALSLTDVYFDGTEEEWSNVSVYGYNDPLLNATMHFAEKSFNIAINVTSAGNSDGVTIEILQNGEVIGTNEGSAHTFEKIKEGNYVIRLSKSKHCPKEIELSVADTDVTANAVIWLYGDVMGDGSVNNIDVLQINRMNANLASVFNQTENIDYRLKVANITAITGTDTIVNNSDVLQINRKNANLSSIFDRIA